MTKEHPKWFQSWFDTPYYHILYKHRDFKEAEDFIKNLVSYLNIDTDDSILDLACGKGRHSIFLNTLGYNVTGLDLSKNNIEHAKVHESNSLFFEVHDMRNTYGTQFEVVLNLFTSFGYFDNKNDNINNYSNKNTNANTSSINKNINNKNICSLYVTYSLES